MKGQSNIQVMGDGLGMRELGKTHEELQSLKRSNKGRQQQRILPQMKVSLINLVNCYVGPHYCTIDFSGLAQSRAFEKKGVCVWEFISCCVQPQSQRGAGACRPPGPECLCPRAAERLWSPFSLFLTPQGPETCPRLQPGPRGLGMQTEGLTLQLVTIVCSCDSSIYLCCSSIGENEQRSSNSFCLKPHI